MFILACLWTAVVTFSAVGSVMRVRYRLNHRAYVVVEGIVSDFVPGGGHDEELWHVRSGDEDHRYHYKASVVTAGYRQTQSQGGAIRNGVRVRVADIDGLIAQLEVATNDLPASP